MKRVEHYENATLYLGDCREVLPALAKGMTCIISDPVWPNAPTRRINSNIPRAWRKRPPSHGVAGVMDPDALFRDFCRGLPRTLRQTVFIMRNDSDPRMMRFVPKWLPFQQMVWLQYVVPGYLGRVLGGIECGYVFGHPIKSVPGRRVIPSVGPKAQPSDRPNNGHPMSRALVHFEWLITWFSEYGETVVDPFMGSGTTGVAAVRLGRKFVGIEIEPQFFDIACRQVGLASRQQRIEVGT